VNTASKKAKPNSVQRLVWIGSSLIVGAGAAAYALYKVDLSAVGSALSQANYIWLFPILVLLGLYWALMAIGWALLLRSTQRFTARAVFPSMMIGMASNNLLPMRLGEFARVFALAHRHTISAGAVIGSLILERFIDILIILVLYLIGHLMVPELPPALRSAASVFALVLSACAVGIGLFLFAPEPFLRAWTRVSRFLPGTLRKAGTGLLDGLHQGLRTVHSIGRLAAVVALAFAKWISTVGMMGCTLLAFHIPVTLGMATIATVVSALAIALPSTPGFVGTLQAAFILGLSPFGVSPSTAFAASVLYLLSGWIPTTLTGIICMARMGLHFADLRRKLDEADPEGVTHRVPVNPIGP
jgi:glycosyltransferase 2 family protein